MKTVESLVSAKATSQLRPLSHAEVAWFGHVLDADVRAYLSSCLTDEGFGASGMNVASHDGLAAENLENASPGCFLFPFGFIVIATSVGGNAVCVDAGRGAVHWADHAYFFDDLISYEDRATGQWHDLYEYTVENVRRALVPLAPGLAVFLKRLLADELTAELDELDG